MILEINSKQRAYLRSMCNTLPVVLYIGKEGITDGTIKEAWDALEAREIIKCCVQHGCDISAREACELLCSKVHAAPVQTIGNRFTIYRESRDHKHIDLP